MHYSPPICQFSDNILYAVHVCGVRAVEREKSGGGRGAMKPAAIIRRLQEINAVLDCRRTMLHSAVGAHKLMFRASENYGR